MKRQVLSAMLTKEAFERLSRVRMVNHALAGQAEIYLLQMVQTKGLSGRITDDQMKQVLQALSEKKETKIRRI